MHGIRIKLMVNGVSTSVEIPGGLQSAHGTGLDGKTKVKSLKFAPHPQKPGQFVASDDAGNATTGTADEFFALLQHIAPDYTITAVKKTV